MGGSLCTGTWASEDCLIYGLTEETQTEGESVAVTSQITIEGIRGLYTAKDIQRESVFEKRFAGNMSTMRRAGVLSSPVRSDTMKAERRKNGNRKKG